MIQNSQGLIAFSANLKNQNVNSGKKLNGVNLPDKRASVLLPNHKQSVLLPSASIDLANCNVPQMNGGSAQKAKYADREFQLGKHEGDYVKNLMMKNNSFLRGNTMNNMKSPAGKSGP